jgi:hypothetical protein
MNVPGTQSVREGRQTRPSRPGYDAREEGQAEAHRLEEAHSVGDCAGIVRVRRRQQHRRRLNRRSPGEHEHVAVEEGAVVWEVRHVAPGGRAAVGDQREPRRRHVDPVGVVVALQTSQNFHGSRVGAVGVVVALQTSQNFHGSRVGAVGVVVALQTSQNFHGSRVGAVGVAVVQK